MKKEKKEFKIEHLMLTICGVVLVLIAYSKDILPYISNSKLFFLILSLYILILLNSSQRKDLEERIEKLETKK